MSALRLFIGGICLCWFGIFIGNYGSPERRTAGIAAYTAAGFVLIFMAYATKEDRK